MSYPKISIITVCYNAVEIIEETILSVISQTYSNIEYIVIDGASTDGTVDVIGRYSDKIAYFVSEPDNGIYDALNKGVKIANGLWIGLLNCGDVFHNNHVIEDMFRMPVDDNVGVLYGGCVELDYGVSKCCNIVPASPHKGIPPQYRHGASFVRNAIHKEFLFDLSQSIKYHYSLDYLQIVKMYRAGIEFQYVDVVVLDYQKDGMSNHPLKNKYYRALIENDGKQDVLFFFSFAKSLFSAVVKKIIQLLGGK